MTDCFLSIDIEDWFHAHNLRPVIHRSEWGSCDSRVERTTHDLLDILDDHNTRATFFVLGWVAERFPGLVDEICRRGHEVASQGYNHELLYDQAPEEVTADIERSLKILEDHSSQAIRGYRAPSFSITDWAVDILKDLDFTYDSRYFPVGIHDRYGRLSVSNPRSGTFEVLENG